MRNYLPEINPAQEERRITSFLKRTFKKQNISKAVIGLSGGVDSTTSYYLLKKILPEKNILAVSLPYNSALYTSRVKSIVIPIKSIANKILQEFKINPNRDKIRAGNIMARIRMVILYDIAKKNNALVCGTENKTEELLGYFTRFGDQASDIEPIRHLYKTQVYQLAKYLGVPKNVLDTAPTAGLWPGQTDEGEFGFTYKEADHVLYLYFEKKLPVKKIIEMGFLNAKKIIDFSNKNSFKHKTPYHV